MLSAPPTRVAIVGAGLAGLALAISLHRQGISCSIYELREPSASTPGALMLSPNALHILDTLGLYDRLRPQGYNFESIAFKNHDGVTTDTYYLGGEKLYKYKALRIYRQVLLTELRAEVKRLQIPVTYGVKFSHVVSEDDSGVTFAFVDGTSASAGLLVGADGIHSTVRKHIAPSVVPKYGGLVAITCAIQKSTLTFPASTSPDEYPMPVSIHSKNGAFVMAPQNIDGSEVLAGTQRAWPEQDRAGWDALLANKPQLLELFRANIQDWPTIVQSALNNVSTDTLAIWPFYVVPKLDRWFSPAHRVVILGDAAHAIPPTAGQGASQGFEDAFTLAALLAGLAPKLPLDRALTVWKDMRQQRVDRVINLTLQLNAVRLPQAERDALAAEGKLVWQTGADGELAWLYNADVEREVRDFIEAEKRG
ncbi:kynurenine 3-monooxygenase [Dothidotthia symphoricarpi CBS 119687]|uniref:Kynurenine 3-monooxygenase n=1 Tax=Dothidotthia symphoricarpi CBS 119687 TaxID=1392245 RepID=A0A6A6A0L0_9PLEO|nr:kynurenine 3-monooxygenase [Dothidotthia symphoricarpi CBS 119687]KAF2124238.1 kynurenine 3-monooxygenase [Dothidotthia symphoricarpi CBS 119687]